jgi:GTP-binding protein
VADKDGPFRMLATTLEANPYLGRLLTGRIESGRVRANMAVKSLTRDGQLIEQGRISKILAFRGLDRQPVDEAEAGDIVALSGFETIEIGRTFTAVEHPERLAGIAVEEPTISVDVIVNNSPFAGREGKYVTSRQLKDRLYRELERNVALRVEETDSPDTHTVSGRGELHLGIMMETMRREGYEFQVSRPRVITKLGDDGERQEPYEELTVDVPEEYMGVVMEKLGPRRSEMIEMRNPGQGMVRLTFRIPSRGLFGYRSEFLTDTRGTGIMHHRYMDYGPWAGPLTGRKRGVLVADREGSVVAFALGNLQERAQMFVSPGDLVYEGMIAGENSRPGDLDVNVTKEKKLTNMRTTASDENVILEPPRQITLEYALEYIEEDELSEITPKTIRLRKRVLTANDRKKAARAARVADAS